MSSALDVHRKKVKGKIRNQFQFKKPFNSIRYNVHLTINIILLCVAINSFIVFILNLSVVGERFLFYIYETNLSGLKTNVRLCRNDLHGAKKSNNVNKRTPPNCRYKLMNFMFSSHVIIHIKYATVIATVKYFHLQSLIFAKLMGALVLTL